MTGARRVARDYGGLLIALVLLIAFFGFRSKFFFTPATFQSIASQIPAAVLIAVGMTFVVMTGGIDLSVGSVVGLCGVALGIGLTTWRLPLPIAIAHAVVVGLLCGLANGFVASRWKLPPFLVTLGMLEIARGGAFLLSGSRTLYIGRSVEGLASARLWGVSAPFLIAVFAVIAAQIVLSRTRFGRYVVATGSNDEVLRLSGIDPRPIRVASFAICGALCGLASAINVSRMSSADPNAGTGFELTAIAAVVIGGTRLRGGSGSVIGSLFGVLLIAVLGTGLAQIGAQEPVKRLVTGSVIVLAVIVDHYRRRD